MFACMTTLFGCQNKSFDDGSTWEKFDLNSFELCDMSNERYEIVSPDSIDFANPTNIRIVSDNLLAVEDTKKKESVICFLNPLTHEYTKTLSTGKSTSEVVHISNIWAQNKSLHCYESTGKILKLECNPNTFETKTSLMSCISTFLAGRIAEEKFLVKLMNQDDFMKMSWEEIMEG